MVFTVVFPLNPSISHLERYKIVFRNAGFAISTVLGPLPFRTTKPYDVAMALAAMTGGLVIMSVFA